MTTEINWGYNCHTSGVHHGRPEAVWNLPLFQALAMFGTDALKELVVARVYTDAMQFVEYKGSNPVSLFTEEWAARMQVHAEAKFDDLLRAKMAELVIYYDSTGWASDVKNMIAWYQDGKLNPHYQPLHSHDSINMLCRILGGMCAREA